MKTAEHHNLLAGVGHHDFVAGGKEAEAHDHHEANQRYTQPCGYSVTPATFSPTQDRLWLTILNLGHVPSFKNSKMIIARGRSRPFLITKPERQEWMEKCIQSFVSQLSLKCQTGVIATPMELCPPSLIALSVPEDDSVHYIPEISIVVEFVEKGQEGAEIIIEPLK